VLAKVTAEGSHTSSALSLLLLSLQVIRLPMSVSALRMKFELWIWDQHTARWWRSLCHAVVMSHMRLTDDLTCINVSGAAST
jgi:hypothetical protein